MNSIETIQVHTSPAYAVSIGPGLLAQCGPRLAEVLGPCRMAVVTDSNVAPLYLDTAVRSLKEAGFSVSAYVFPAGEASKHIGTLSNILEFLAGEQLTRTDCVAALGGGVTGDMAGLAAALYLRGIRYVQLPTTLLAAVDSSVGGKTAIDLGAGKNLAGAFLQPAAVLCDTDCLSTLAPEVLACGAAEAIKTGVLSGEDLFTCFENGSFAAAPGSVISQCVRYKASVVERDPTEQGERKLLNLGHTVGHAIEKCSGYAIPHGHAVAAGLAVMARASEKFGWTDDPVSERITACLQQNSLPTGTQFSAVELALAALADKKRAGDSITLVVPRAIGRCELKKLPVSELRTVIAAGLEAEMDIRIEPRKLAGTISPPPSKSMAHRAVLAMALAQGTGKLSNLGDSQDIRATQRCVAALRTGGDGLPLLDCGESGSTLRFLVPLALVLRGGGVFTGRGRLMERPQKPYFDLFDEKGVLHEQKDGVLTVRGTLKPGTYRLPGDVSSQFVTGLLYALPLLDGDSELEITSPLESRGYVDLTLDMLAQFGVQVKNQNCRRFLIPGGQAYQARDLTVEADWSQAAFWYGANLLGELLDIRGLDPLSAQGDRAVHALCETLSRPGDVNIDVSGIPDLVPPLAVMAAIRRGTTVLSNAARLRMKESDRLKTTCAMLNGLDGWAAEDEDRLVINGVPSFAGGTVDGANDHRIVMAAAIAATASCGPVTILGAQAVNKSYPSFWEEYTRLGGEIHVL